MTDDTSPSRSQHRLQGQELLERPLLNRSTAFTEDERDDLGLRGLLPPHVESLDEQAARAWQAFTNIPADDPLARHLNLRALQDNDEVLFYRVLADHIAETLPIVYTPTVGEACQRFSEIYRRPRGLFVSYPEKDRLREVLRNRPTEDVDVIVVTDGGRILGLGDQGAGGMGIAIGKLSLYTAVGGIDPGRALPIILDVGTDNDKRINDPLYVGWRHARISGEEYDEFVDAFVQAVKDELPGTLLQWEDFPSSHAQPILDRYRDQMLTFNDDIQGTAAVVAGAMTGATAVSSTRLRDQRVVILGKGSAAIGVADRLMQAMIADGADEDDAVSRLWVLDHVGLVLQGQEGLSDGQQRYAKSSSQVSSVGLPETDPDDRDSLDLAGVVGAVHPTTLIGLSTAPGAFTEAIVKDMASHVDRPIIMPLSNPTSKSEAAPQDLADWTDDRALVATGSPYDPVNGRDGQRRVAQCNNVYIFPAMGLGVLASGATRVTESMFLAASLALGKTSPVHDDPHGALLPEVANMPKASDAIALAVAKQAIADGVAPKATDDQLRLAVRTTRWSPAYRGSASSKGQEADR